MKKRLKRIMLEKGGVIPSNAKKIILGKKGIDLAGGDTLSY